MKKTIFTTFALAFVILFSLSLTLFAFFEPTVFHNGGMMDMSGMMIPENLTKIWLLLFVSGLVSLVISLVNYGENIRIRQDFVKDIERLNINEIPLNPEVAQVAKHIRDLTGEIQRLSNPSTEMRAEIIEEERKRISRELHDSVSQELFAATMILSSVEGSTDLKSIQSQTLLSLKILHEAQNEMRALLLHLRPIELDGKSLSIGLTGLINELTAKISANINYRLDDVHSSPTIEDNLFRMAQEVLSNTLRHAHAENIDISLRENLRNIILTIADDGIGFDQTEKRATSYGLSNLKERALLLGGHCDINTAPNHGTKVEIRVPKVSNDTSND
ncbi:sensor histidine kinase [Lactovum miscens]|uniref:histidine kinase n=1 Tax=Lactovum miscens TaxID=190387 RepID=A0A841C4C3_9LACT|nr:sensor histidine kinase [Lactovum miscens]MBB5887194.1 NarL family two-component system sensor histidine kinase LiaS [Lactovum miscens]